MLDQRLHGNVFACRQACRMSAGSGAFHVQVLISGFGRGRVLGYCRLDALDGEPMR